MASRKITFQLLILNFLFLLTNPLFNEAILSSSSDGNLTVGCIEMERQALLKFKEALKDPSGWLSSWVGQDCCNWMGVSCSNQTGNVVKLDLKSPDVCDLVNVSEPTSYNRTCLGGTLNPSLLNLTYLNYLDLSDNNFQGNLIPSFLGSLKNLRYLDLSRASFAGMVPPSLGNLSYLYHLDLTFYSYPKMLFSSLNWLSGLSSLQFLGLGGMNLSMASTNWLQAVNMLPSLLELELSSCELHDLPQSLPYVNFTSLTALDLSFNNFSSSIPQWLFNISTLVNVDLYSCQLTGSIPKISWGNLCSLQFLDLSYNGNSGEINDLIGALSGCSNSTFHSLDLSSNNLHGHLPDSLGSLRDLEYLQLSQNSISGPLPTSIGNLSRLGTLDLSFSMLNGTISENIGQLSRLFQLGLYGNLWEGIITETHLQNLTRLLDLSLSSTQNSLVFNLRRDWIPSFSLTSIAIRGCQLSPEFPAWLQTQKRISQLTLSNASISDTIPNWFWTFSPRLWWVDLSDNRLRGKLPNSIGFGYDVGAWIDLGFNSLEGSIPLWPNVTDLSFRNNLFSGPIPSNIGQEMSRLQNLDLSRNFLNSSIPLSINKMRSLSFLDLSNNYLSGTIPSQWQGMQMLMVLDLSKNNLSGGIPSSMCTQPALMWLKLSSNNLSGDLSSALQNCTGLFSLDLGENRFSGTIPKWIGEILPSLFYLGLRSNTLTGSIPEELCQFPILHILDLAHNNLSGSIPGCLGSLEGLKYFEVLFKFLPSTQHIEFSQHAELVVKGRKNEYTKLIPLVNIIDLSSNNITGEVPEEITNLSSLGTLNLSWNQLTGKIPENIGSLQRLENLDLSHNHLSGPIPPSMSSMTLLDDLNLSYNNLSGRIPSSTQLQSFNVSVYEGNPELCGPPLSTSCSAPPDEDTKHKDDRAEDEGRDDQLEMLWFYVSMGLGFIVGFWAVCGTLVIKKSWRHAYFKFVDDMKDRLFVLIAVNVARLRRKGKVERQ